MLTYETRRVSGPLLFRLAIVATCVGQMAVYYDTATKTVPAINYYLLGNMAFILLALVPWHRTTQALWWLVWPAGLLLRLDWATRPTNSDVYWATSQGVDFLLHGLNPYTQVYTWVYQHQPGISNYPSYSYFPGGLFAEIPFYLLGNVRLGLALADLGTGLLIYLIARGTVGEWAARGVAAVWLLFMPLFAIAMLLSVLDFILFFWIALAVWLYLRKWYVGSALAAAMVFGTKQYGFLFAVPWGLLLLRPVVERVIARWKRGDRLGRWRSLLKFSRREWLPPTALVAMSALVVLPLALLSPAAFYDATVQFHAKQPPVPMLGTPQWNESLPAQLAALGWVDQLSAQPIAQALAGVLMLGILVFAALKIKDAPSALMWSALLSGVSFGFSNGRVQFFYWRLPLLLFLLYVLLSFLPAQQPPVREPESIVQTIGADAEEAGLVRRA